MGDQPDELEVRKPDRNWGTIREWLNVAAALGALLVGVVSFWTTARISGLEDYLRSEISRRNNDLNQISDQSRRLASLAEDRAERLATLQTATDQITASNLTAQGRLLATQQELSRIAVEVIAAKQAIVGSETRLASLREQSEGQSHIIDLYRRQRFFENAHSRIVFGTIGYEGTGLDGESVFKTLIGLAVGDLGPDLATYVPEFRSNAQNTCQPIRNYKPAIPETQEYPPSPKRPGKLSADGSYSLVTNRELEGWNAAFRDWNNRWSQASDANSRRLKAQLEAREYITKAAASCVCRALATAKHPANSICPGYDRPPARPEPPPPTRIQ